MSRYIDTDALIEEINSLSVTLCGKEIFGELAKHSVVQKINEAPTANVAPIADTVRKMQERIKADAVTIQDHTGKLGVVVGVGNIDDVAREMLEGDNEN